MRDYESPFGITFWLALPFALLCQVGHVVREWVRSHTVPHD